MRNLVFWIIVVVFTACLAFGAGWMAGSPGPDDETSLRRAVKDLSDDGKCVGALVQLLGHNNVAGPAGNYFWLDSVEFQVLDAVNQAGCGFRMVRVPYKDPWTGDRTYSFVFDEEGTCVLHSYDGSMTMRDLWLADITQDGEVEALVSFERIPAASHRPRGSMTDEALQIWRLHRGSSEKLMDLYCHNANVDPDDRVFFVFVSSTGDGRPWRIELGGFEHARYGSMVWSPDQGAFVGEGLDPERFEFLPPSPGVDERPMKCPFDSEHEITDTKACPICGMTRRDLAPELRGAPGG